MQIQKATITDIKTIQSLAKIIWPPTFKNILVPAQIDYMLEMMYSASSLEEQMKVNGHTFLMIYKEGIVKGFASYELNYKNSTDLKIHKIYILPDVQGFGLGKALLSQIQNAGKKSNQGKLVLNVNRFNKATSFYIKLGFEQVGVENIDIGGGFLMEDFIFEKAI